MIKEILIKIRDFTAEQWFRFQIGVGMLSIINLALLAVTASDKLQEFIPFKISEVIVGVVVCALVGTWFIGFTIEQIKFYREQQRNLEKRSPIWSSIQQKLDRINEKLDKLEKNHQ